MDEEELRQRKALARALLSEGIEPEDLQLRPDTSVMSAAAVTASIKIPFPAGLAPTPQPITPLPQPSDALPRADVVIVTWTVAEQDALAGVFTPGYGRLKWARYDRGFQDKYAGRIRKGAPALLANRLGSWFVTKIGQASVLCFKSELHLNQDGVKTGDGTATLPVKDLLAQIIGEVRPKVFLTVGTSGSVFADYQLGDVVVSRSAKFRLHQEFKNEAFNGRQYMSDWLIPTDHFQKAEELMSQFGSDLQEPPLGPPTKRYHFNGPFIDTDPNTPDIKLDGRDMPPFHPILTTDYFEYGTSANHLEQEGCAVEMGDAVLGLVCEEETTPPKWAAVRNMSDPVINADLPSTPRRINMQDHWAVWYYQAYGYYTSITGALAAWAIVAGLKLQQMA